MVVVGAPYRRRNRPQHNEVALSCWLTLNSLGGFLVEYFRHLLETFGDTRLRWPTFVSSFCVILFGGVFVHCWLLKIYAELSIVILQTESSNDADCFIDLRTTLMHKECIFVWLKCKSFKRVNLQQHIFLSLTITFITPSSFSSHMFTQRLWLFSCASV